MTYVKRIQSKLEVRLSKEIPVTLTITKTCLYNFEPLKPYFYIVKLGFTGVYIIFLIFARKPRLWVFVRTASPRRFNEYQQSMF